MTVKRYRVDGSHAGFNDSVISIFDGAIPIGILDGLQEITIKDSLDIGEEREIGNPMATDVVTGDYSVEGSFVFKAEAWDRIARKLNARGRGVYGTAFGLVWTYENKDKTRTTIDIPKLYIKSRERSGKTGSEALKVNKDFMIFGCWYENGYDPFGNKK